VLVSASAVSANGLRDGVNGAQLPVVGPTPNWIDRAAHGHVVYLYGGEQFWNVVWQERFWNRGIDRVLSLDLARVPGPMPQTGLVLGPDGRLGVPERYAVASNHITFVGAPVAHLTQTGLDDTGLTLWQLDSPGRVSTVTHNVLPNGDMTQPASIDVFGCTRGRLELTLLPKRTDVLEIQLDGRVVMRRKIGGRSVWRGSVPVRASTTPRQCTFTIVPNLLLGSTRIDFVRD
jgi:hypothetical protein